MAWGTTQTGYSPSIEEACDLYAPPSRQLPDRRTEVGAGISEVLRTFAGLAREATELAKVSALRRYHRARKGAIDNYSSGARRAQELATRTWNRAGDLKREHPVQVLAVLLGAAFLAGVAGRMWRSRSL